MGLKQSSSELKGMRHTAGIVLIAALQRLIPRIEPLELLADDVSFELQFLLDVPLPEGMLPEIEQQMVSIIREQPLIESVETLSSNAADYFDKRGQHILAEDLRVDPKELIPIVRMGDLMFPCETPHELDTGVIRAIKLMSIDYDAESGVSTIRGTAFPDRKELRQFLKRSELARGRDHRQLVRELQLFGRHQGDWFWLPKGAIIRSQLLLWWYEKVLDLGFTAVSYLTEEDPPLAHARIYAATMHSYRDLPQRYCEIIEVREPDIRSCGLFQTHAFRTDALSVFCRADQLPQQLKALVELVVGTLSLFGLAYDLHISGVKRKAFQDLLQEMQLEYSEEESSFPQETTLEVHIEDALGRLWIGPRITLHHALPDGQRLQFQAADGDMRTPVQISATLFSSIERFTALLIEHFAGGLPLWLAPEQLRIIPVSERHIDYCEQVRNTIASRHLRVGTDLRRDTLSARVFAAENSRVPFVLVVGDQEEREGCVTVRDSRSGTVVHGVNLTNFLQQVLEEAGQRKTTHKHKH